MASKAFKADMLQFKNKLDLLYKEAQAMLLRHGADSPHAAKLIMPHLEMAKNATAEVLNPETNSN
jgi:hypothetical protein